jgi:NAD(P)-dependent dehydrogenase (short-subunit alcohol dehydrogenase family)
MWFFQLSEAVSRGVRACRNTRKKEAAMGKRIFLAGAGGAIGRPLSRLLVGDGWDVVGTTRSPGKALSLSHLGVWPVIVDAFDAQALKDAVIEARPDVIIHQLTDLPPGLDPALMNAARLRNARLREDRRRKKKMPRPLRGAAGWETRRGAALERDRFRAFSFRAAGRQTGLHLS